MDGWLPVHPTRGRHSHNVVLMVGQRCRRRPSIGTMLDSADRVYWVEGAAWNVMLRAAPPPRRPRGAGADLGIEWSWDGGWGYGGVGDTATHVILGSSRVYTAPRLRRPLPDAPVTWWPLRLPERGWWPTHINYASWEMIKVLCTGR